MDKRFEDRNSASWPFLLYAFAGVAVVVLTGLTINQVFRDRAIDDVRSQAATIAAGRADELRSELSRFRLLPMILSEDSEVGEALANSTSGNVDRLNMKLAELVSRTGVAYLYAIDTSGVTIAASNYEAPDSFVGRDYSFRPYFRGAMQAGQATYFAIGERTGKPGLFLSRKVMEDGANVGAIVAKVEFEDISARWSLHDDLTIVSNADDVILLASDASLLATSLSPLSTSRIAELTRTRQFGSAPPKPSPLKLSENFLGIDQNGRSVQGFAVDIADPAWRVVTLRPVSPALSEANTRTMLWTTIIAVLLAALSLLFLWRLQQHRQKVQTTALLKAEVARQTRELSVANEQLETEFAKREEANKRFRAAREELAQANRLGSIAATATSVAHEVNQPVAAIRTYAENCRKFVERGNEEATLENLNSIIHLSDRIGLITSELRRYARRGKQGITAVPLDEVMGGVDLLIGERLRSSGVDFEILPPDGEWPKVKAGRVRLEQVMVNLVQNALDAVAQEDNPVIRISIARTPKEVCITVDDNGPGVPPDISRQIFDPFFSGKADGVGIGLGIARDIVSEFEGELSLASSKLGGAAFEVRLQRR